MQLQFPEGMLRRAVGITARLEEWEEGVQDLYTLMLYTLMTQMKATRETRLTRIAGDGGFDIWNRAIECRVGALTTIGKEESTK